MINIITIEGQRYAVDVGFGSNDPIFPVPLWDGFTGANVAGGHAVKIEHTSILDTTHKENLLWVLSVRFKDTKPWLPAYCFSDTVEFLPKDFEIMNFFVSRSPTSWFTYHVVCLRFIIDEETEEMIGEVTLFDDEISERKYGKSTDLMKIESEEDRIEALEKFIGVKLTTPEREGISGMVSMIS
jgi:arylamine N-acetyltransferase